MSDIMIPAFQYEESDRTPFLTGSEAGDTFELKVVDVRGGLSKQNSLFIAVDYAVLKSENPEHPAGSKCTIYHQFDKFNKYKQILPLHFGAIVGEKPENIGSAEIKALVATKEQTLVGRRISVRAKKINYVKKGTGEAKTFTEYSHFTALDKPL